MAYEEHLKILNQGVRAWNQWRRDNPLIEPNLSSAQLSGANLSFAQLSGTNLSEANLNKTHLSAANLSGARLTDAHLRQAIITRTNLSRAYLTYADLREANLYGANLSGADLIAADLKHADLSRAYLIGADLRSSNLDYANLSEANLSGANFTNTILFSTIFGNVDLSKVKGLENVEHQAPSIIGIDTIYRSQGNIPEAFLRGAGVPVNFIKYVHSLVGTAMQFYSCFISYSTKDQEFAERLHSDLQSKGVRVWFAPDDIKGGRKLHEQIPEAIKVYDKLLLVLSENSMRSEWVKTEISHARQDEIRDNKRKLFPIGLVDFETIRNWEAFDADTGKDMGREIREYFIPDFSRWKYHHAYTKAFDRLLRDLEAEG